VQNDDYTGLDDDSLVRLLQIKFQRNGVAMENTSMNLEKNPTGISHCLILSSTVERVHCV
jgi:hypothetical protein